MPMNDGLWSGGVVHPWEAEVNLSYPAFGEQ